MRTSRTSKERLTDALLSLVLLSFCADDKGSIGDRLKVAKLQFLAMQRLYIDQVKGFNYSFYRYAHGPFTTELYETWSELCWMNFLEVPAGPGENLKLTTHGVEAAAKYSSRLEALGNRRVLDTLKYISDTYAQLDTTQLLKKVYEMDVTPVGWQKTIKIGQVPMSTFLTCVLDASEAVGNATFDESVLNDFYNELPRARRPGNITDDAYKDIYSSVAKGLQLEKAGLPGKIVSLDQIRQKARQ